MAGFSGQADPRHIVFLFEGYFRRAHTIPAGDTYASPINAKATMKSDDRKKVNIMKAKYMVT